MIIKSVNPASLKVIGTTKCCSEKDVVNAVAAARKAQKKWAATSTDDRISLLQHVRNELKKNSQELVSTLMHEIGKPKIEAELEMLDSMQTIDYYCSEVKKLQHKAFPLDKELYPETSAAVEFVPHGVIGLITPWNYPLSLSFWTIAPALLAGNTIVYKPSKSAILVGKRIDEIMQHVLPKNVFHTILGNARVGKWLVKLPVDKLFFTGNVSTGEWIMKNAGIKPLALELGGKDAAIVCSDADIDLAAEGIVWGAMTNSGQCCVAAEQVFVEQEVYAEFLTKSIAVVKKLRAGKDYGPIVNAEQLKKIESLVSDAKKKGAKVLLGGKRAQGYWFEPTIITNAKPNMRVCKEEIFGPVMLVHKVGKAEDAVYAVNKGTYGLGCSIWSKNTLKAKKIADNVNSGMVWINDVNLPLPGGDYWGGVKNSGLRNTESKFMQCLKAKIVLKYSRAEKRMWWYPYG